MRDVHELDNLMLLCPEHHKIVDAPARMEDYPVSDLLAMKRDHELRVDMVEDFLKFPEQKIVLYGANISDVTTVFNKTSIRQAILYAGFTPGEVYDLHGPDIRFDTDYPYNTQAAALRTRFLSTIDPALVHSRIAEPSIGVFAVAPQPLLIYLGVLFSDIRDVRVYQLHREPHPHWTWGRDHGEKCADQPTIEFPNTPDNPNRIFLKVGISAEIDSSRLPELTPNDAVVSIRVGRPHRGWVESTSHLAMFRECAHMAIEAIAQRYGRRLPVHIAIAAPVSASVEIGRVWQRKAHPPIIAMDTRPGSDEFFDALAIDG